MAMEKYIVNFSQEALAEIEICESLSKQKREKGELFISHLIQQRSKFEDLRNHLLEEDIDEAIKSELVRLVNDNINSCEATIDELKKKIEGTR